MGQLLIWVLKVEMEVRLMGLVEVISMGLGRRLPTFKAHLRILQVDLQDNMNLSITTHLIT